MLVFESISEYKWNTFILHIILNIGNGLAFVIQTIKKGKVHIMVNIFCCLLLEANNS